MKNIIYVFIILVILSGCTLEKRSANVYFCGGQSNATTQWSYGIEQRIWEVDPGAIIIQNNHPGQSILTWSMSGERNVSYVDDIKNIKEVLENVNYDLKGIFWFQGEQDIKNIELDYKKEFYNMISFFKEDLNDYDFDIFTTLIQVEGLDCTTFRAMQQNISDTDPRVYTIDSLGYIRRDGVHLLLSQYIILGIDTATIAVNAIY